MENLAVLLQKLAKVQQGLHAPKDQHNGFGGYNYRSCESILKAVKTLLDDNKLVLIMSDKLVCVQDRNYVEVTATIYDIETGASLSNTAYAREELTKKGMDGSQITGASSSYARKYALNGLFCIDDTKDSDVTNDGKPEPITEEQIEEIKELQVNTFNACKNFGVKKVEELTREQAEYIISKKRESLKG